MLGGDREERLSFSLPQCDNPGNEVHVSGGSGGQVRAKLGVTAPPQCGGAPSSYPTSARPRS